MSLHSDLVKLLELSSARPDFWYILGQVCSTYSLVPFFHYCFVFPPPPLCTLPANMGSQVVIKPVILRKFAASSSKFLSVVWSSVKGNLRGQFLSPLSVLPWCSSGTCQYVSHSKTQPEHKRSVLKGNFPVGLYRSDCKMEISSFFCFSDVFTIFQVLAGVPVYLLFSKSLSITK